MTQTVEDFIKTANKTHGVGAVIRLGDKPSWKYGENVIPTGSQSLNYALGIGGIPRGRITEVLGNPSAGKSTLCLHIVAEAQAMGLNTLYIDAEHALDVFYADRIGVNVDDLFLHQPTYGEQALRIADEAIRSGSIGLIVVDSVAALVPKRELDGDIGDSHMGLVARMMSQMCRMISGSLSNANAAIVFVNQYRATMSTGGFGGPSKAPSGGSALNYAASVIIDLARVETVKEDGQSTANRTQVTVKKNKLAPPYRVAEFNIVYGEGIDVLGELIDMAESFDIIKKSGSWYKDGDVTAQGKNKLSAYMQENPEYLALVKSRVESHIAQIMKRDDDANN